MPITFPVDKVKQAQPKLSANDTSPKWHTHFFKQELTYVGIKAGSVEARKFNAEVISLESARLNSFVMTAMKAYDQHVPLVLSPDDVSIAVIQAVSNHINMNPEDARKAIVPHDGKLMLVVELDDFQKGNPDNDWQRAFNNFSQVIDIHLGKKRELFDPTFSTTGIVEKAAIQVQMMGALAPFYEYYGRTMCGLPSVTLLGTPEDWESIYTRINAFGEFYPGWALVPMLDAVAEFVDAVKGKVNLDFWQNFVKISGDSGGPYISGWINAFFPYLHHAKNFDETILKPNFLMNDPKKTFRECMENRHRGGPNSGAYPSSISGASMTWRYYETTYKMKLASGIFGTTIQDGGYRPAIGWAVGEEK